MMDNLEFNPIVYSSIEEQISEVLIDYIKNGIIKPGDYLPPERELANKFQVSRVPVRESLKKLEAMGVVEIQHGKGAKVRGINHLPLINAITEDVHGLSLEDTITDLTEARLVIEVGAAKLAAVRRDSEDIIRMQKALQMMENSIANDDKGTGASLEFHMSVIKGSHNRTLYNLMAFLMEVLRQSREYTLARREGPVEAHEDHKKIYDAIFQGDSFLASQAMKKHLSNLFIEKNKIREVL